MKVTALTQTTSPFTMKFTVFSKVLSTFGLILLFILIMPIVCRAQLSLLKDINQTAVAFGESDPTLLINLNGKIIFIAEDGTHGRELWVSDGTPSGTQLLKDIRSGPTGGLGIYTVFKVIGGTLYFIADDGVTSNELWKTDGTSSGTTIVKDILPGIGSGFESISEFEELNGQLYFTARDGSGSFFSTLWKSDGSAAGTVPVTTQAAFFGSSPIVKNNNTLFFTGSGTAGSGLYKFDGTNVLFVKQGSYGNLLAGGPYVYMSGFNSGWELWRSDGTDGGTVRVKDIYPGPSGSNPVPLVYLNGILYFSAVHPSYGSELWRSDGTDAGTTIVKDLNPDTYTGSGGYGSGFYGAQSTAQVFYYSDVVAYNNNIYFSGYRSGSLGQRAVFKSDGTDVGTQPILNGNSTAKNFKVSNGKLYFTRGGVSCCGLKESDGTQLGTYEIVASSVGVEDYLDLGDKIIVAAEELYILVKQTPQTITFPAIDAKAPNDPPFALSATTSSGLAVSYTSSNTAVATISGNTVTIHGLGTTTITASQSGDGTYYPAASAVQVLSVFQGIPISNTTINICSNQLLDTGGPGDYAIDQDVTMTLAPSTAGAKIKLSFSAFDLEQDYDFLEIYDGPTTGSPLLVTLTGSSIPNDIIATGAGGQLTLHFTSDNTVNGAGWVANISCFGGAAPFQNISFPAIPTKVFNNSPFILNAIASSGLPITYVSSNTAVATISGNILTIEGAGTCNITAKQAGNGTYNPAADVPQTLTINKSTQAIIANKAGLPRSGVFDPQSYSTSGLPLTYAFSNSNAMYLGNNLILPLSSGLVTMTISQAGDNNFNAAPNVLVDFNVLGGNSPSPYTFIRQDGDRVSQYTGGVTGIEVDASGKVYIPSTNLNQIIILNADGSFYKVFGRPGINDGEFSGPTDIGLDASGNVYVADRNNHRIQVFTPDGTFIRKFGGRGAASGKMFSPGGIAVDGSGKVYVMESFNNRVSVFSSAGVFQYSFGSSGTGNGQFSSARGIDVDNAGNIYVADQANSRVQVFTNTGGFIRTFGTSGSGNGQFNLPKHIKVDTSGKIYVTDDTNSRIQIFDNTGSFISTFNWPVITGGVCGIALDASGNIYSSNYNRNEVIKFSPSGTVLKTFTPIPTSSNQVYQPQGVAFDDTNVYVSLGTHEIKVYDLAGNYLRTVGSPGTGDGQLDVPTGIALDNAGNLYVADWGNGRVQVFDNAGAFVRKIGEGTLVGPSRLALDGTGKIYISDPGSNQVFVYQTSGAFVSSFGGTGSGNGQFNLPNGISFDGGGNVLVTDYGNKRVQVFTPSNAFIGAFGAPGTGAGQFNGPTDIKMIANGKIYVLDKVNHSIQVFNSAGVYQYTVGEPDRGITGGGS